MAKIVSSHSELTMKLIRALEIPGHVISFGISAERDCLIRVKAEYYLDEEKAQAVVDALDDRKVNSVKKLLRKLDINKE